MVKPTPKRVEELLVYDQYTGIFTWKKSTNPSIAVGKKAGFVHPNGYVYIGIDGKQYRAHRLAFVIMEGRWPKLQVDHKDRVRSNNKWANLRKATSVQQQGNTGIRKNNKSGYPGVSWQSDCGKWRVKVAGEYIGLLRNKKKAIKARNKQHRKVYGEFSNS